MIQQPHSWAHVQKKWKHKFEKINAPHVDSNAIYNSQDMEATQVSINRYLT